MFASCAHEAVIPNSPEISFSTDVQGIIIGNCTQSGCHASGSDHESFSLVTYDDVMKIVSPGNARNSRLYESIKQKSMPPSSAASLTDQQIKYIYLWIEQGAKNN
jgi:uncharacterized membrane protein